MRYAIGNGQTETIPVKFVHPTDIGLPAPPPPPTREPESEEQGVIEQTQAEARTSSTPAWSILLRPHRCQRAARRRRIRRLEQALPESDGPSEYVNHPQPAATVADAQCIHDTISPGGNTAWAGPVEAIAYAQSYAP